MVGLVLLHAREQRTHTLAAVKRHKRHTPAVKMEMGDYLLPVTVEVMVVQVGRPVGWKVCMEAVVAVGLGVIRERAAREELVPRSQIIIPIVGGQVEPTVVVVVVVVEPALVTRQLLMLIL
jgi:hypothetical protein